MTLPETSPLPRFGIRHLLGLTAALAVAFTLWRVSSVVAVVNNTYDRSYFFSINTILGINFFVVGCLALWRIKFGRFRSEPGHFFAAIGAWHGLMLNITLIFPRSIWLAIVWFVGIGLVSMMAWIDFTHARNRLWRLPLIFFAGCVVIFALFFSRIYSGPMLGFANRAASLSYILFLATTLLSVFVDHRQGVSRHWSHWPAVVTAMMQSIYRIGLAVWFLFG